MADALTPDVLSFVDREIEPRATAPRKTGSRQLAINGVPIGEILGQFDDAQVVSPTAPAAADSASIVRYLKSLIGHPGAEILRPGRVAVAYCAACLDSSCGVMLVTSVQANAEIVRWSAMGLEDANYYEDPRPRAFWKKAEPVEVPADHEWWIPNPIQPEIVYTFSRPQYQLAVQDEINRILGAA
jgi:hypothetical protein